MFNSGCPLFFFSSFFGDSSKLREGGLKATELRRAGPTGRTRRRDNGDRSGLVNLKTGPSHWLISLLSQCSGLTADLVRFGVG